jgi:hypothetical protein
MIYTIKIDDPAQSNKLNQLLEDFDGIEYTITNEIANNPASVSRLKEFRNRITKSQKSVRDGLYLADDELELNMNVVSNKFTTLDISDLPNNACQEIQDFYAFLKNKYDTEKTIKGKKKKIRFFKSIEKHKYHLPDDYSFNRSLINER